MSTTKTKPETHEFQAEVSKLLDLVINSLYREKDIFLRELISNASDACDKLRYAAITAPDLLGDEPKLEVRIEADEKARTITIADNGIGMNREDLIDTLGTIARSGTDAFVKQLASDKEESVSLIGQFGVGFYSAFMVADRVEVFTRKAGEDDGWHWESKGAGAFTIEPDEDTKRGTRIVLHVRKSEEAFLSSDTIRQIIKAYSDHIDLPIWLKLADGGSEIINQASALWTRSKSDIDEDQYREFYHHSSHMPGDPWLTIHMKAEGRLEYTALLFVPDSRPFDLFDQSRQHRVKLYVKRIFITDECEGLLPGYLRFMRGIVDSDDLPLNISRETLQNNPVVAKIRNGIVKRILSDLGKKAKKDPAAYETFWKDFGAVLKEGLYEDVGQKDALIGLARFHSTASDDGWTSLEEYVARMPDGQEAVYYVSGDDPVALRKSPHVEGFRARGIEVLLMADPVDQFWLPTIGQYEDKPFRSVTQGAADLASMPETDDGKKEDEEKTEKPPSGEMDKLVAMVKLTLGDAVKDVRASDRLTDSPVCLVADEGDLDMHMARLLRQHNQAVPDQKRVLEINPGHPLTLALISLLSKKGASRTLDDAAYILLDQARILEGEPLPDPGAFSRRLANLMAQSLN